MKIHHSKDLDRSGGKTPSLSFPTVSIIVKCLWFFFLWGLSSIIDCFHTRAKCAIWIIIWIAHFELSFEWRYFGPCVRQMTSRCVIWNGQFKWRSGGVFQLRISQTSQRNRRMNALTSKLWVGGAELRDLLTTSAYRPIQRAAYIYRSTGNASSVHIWLAGYPDIFLPLRNAKPKFGLSCVHCIIQISQLLLSCEHCVIRMIIEIAHFVLVWKTVIGCLKQPYATGKQA